MAKRRENAYYDPKSITVLEGLAPVRMRPGMYFGDVRDPFIKTALLMQFACTAIDSAISGQSVKLRITLQDRGLALVEADGTALPIERQYDRWAPEVVLTQLHGCYHRYDTWLGNFFCAPGIGPANALCRYVEVDTWTDGRSYHQRFERGHAKPPQLGNSSERGLRFRIALDHHIFPEPFFDAADVERAVTEYAFLVPELPILFFRGSQHVELEELDVDCHLTDAQCSLLLRMLAIDLDVLLKQHPRVSLAEATSVPRRAIRCLAVALATIDHRPSTQFRRNIVRVLEHLKNDRITSLTPYRELWERLVAETSERVMLADLLACGSPEDAAVEIDRRLGDLL